MFLRPSKNRRKNTNPEVCKVYHFPNIRHEKTTIINGKLSIPLQMAGTIILSRTTSLVFQTFISVTAGSLGCSTTGTQNYIQATHTFEMESKTLYYPSQSSFLCSILVYMLYITHLQQVDVLHVSTVVVIKKLLKSSSTISDLIKSGWL